MRAPVRITRFNPLGVVTSVEEKTVNLNDLPDDTAMMLGAQGLQHITLKFEDRRVRYGPIEYECDWCGEYGHAIDTCPDLDDPGDIPMFCPRNGKACACQGQPECPQPVGLPVERPSEPCPERAQRAAMTDAEFWEHVFRRDEEGWAEYAWAMDGPDVWVIECARCGQAVEVEGPEGRERDAFCDDCALETLPHDDELLDDRSIGRCSLTRRHARLIPGRWGRDQSMIDAS